MASENEWADKVKEDLMTLLAELKNTPNWSDNFRYKAVYKMVEAHSDKLDNLYLASKILPLKRENEKSACLTDFVSPDKDFVGIFATSVNVEKNLISLREQEENMMQCFFNFLQID